MRAEQVEDDSDADASPQEMELGVEEPLSPVEATESAMASPARRNWER